MAIGDDPVLFTLLCVNTVIGLALITAAYDLKRLVLGWIGWIGGAVGGGLLGWVVLPTATAGGVAASERLGVTLVLVLIGALFGRILLAFVARFAVGVTAFLVTTLATLVFTVGESVLDVVYDPEDPGDPSLDAVDVAGAADAGLHTQPEVQQLLVVSLLVGSVAGVLAMRNYDLVISVALTGLGAGVLATIASVWQAVLAGEPIAIAQQAELSTTVFAVVLVAGLGIQYLRHAQRDAIANRLG